MILKETKVKMHNTTDFRRYDYLYVNVAYASSKTKSSWPQLIGGEHQWPNKTQIKKVNSIHLNLRLSPPTGQAPR